MIVPGPDPGAIATRSRDFSAPAFALKRSANSFKNDGCCVVGPCQKTNLHRSYLHCRQRRGVWRFQSCFSTLSCRLFHFAQSRLIISTRCDYTVLYQQQSSPNTQSFSKISFATPLSSCRFRRSDNTWDSDCIRPRQPWAGLLVPPERNRRRQKSPGRG